ncbi:MAG: tRNA (N6-isopentenyl adenosine(37)-C2)-methylthiotransferase MiaB [Selenomonadales bacterium]|nr:tRNA (N6-isopentenyl adenosine(37)-C2)-methylthiotransferase MiaB [Selenomonadales bacterium]MBR0326071.1 tRNA (N6-isopentenyl adenosine(37)-C2)-methylthiotransferase MiaB [Selenomonadales bacterium]
MKKYLILTYGCQMNENDSQRLGGLLQKIGYEETTVMEDADAILLNTCCVRESAELKIYGKIGEIKGLKRDKPSLIVGVCGCMAQKNQKALFKRAPHIDFVVGPNNLHDVPNIIAQIGEERKHILATDDGINTESDHVPTVRKQGMTAWVPIMYGCNNFCTYCIVPYVRGRERSRTIAEICTEIEGLALEGCREVTLLGQNVNSYGKGTDEGDFADLLRAVNEIKGIERIRYMTSHPRDMSQRVIEAVRDCEKVCDHFHLPVQAGSDVLLKRMNRGYTTEYYRDLVRRIREANPNATLTTDLIVGFPGETDELFEETLAFVKEMRYDAAYTFLYSKRSGTPAAEMDEQVDIKVKKARLQKLMDMQNENSLELNQAYVGRTVEVMVEGPSKSDEQTWTGRTTGNKIILWPYVGTEKVGDLVNVRVDVAQTWLLKGTLQERG